jgi:hypothetical protein
MSITGHRTHEMFDRYNITSEADLDNAARRLKAFRDAQKLMDSRLNGDNDRDSGPKAERPGSTRSR